MHRQVRVVGVFLLVLLSVMVWRALPIKGGAEPPIAASALVQGNNAFALALYREIGSDKGNIFFSPYSVSSALAMTYAGAAGRTEQQMAQTMNFRLEPDKLHQAFSDLTKSFSAPGKSYQLSIVNSLWGQVGIKFLPEFLAITGRNYDSALQEVDYKNRTEEARLAINRWVEGKTNHKIKELIQPQILDVLTRLVLVNAIYFKASWESQFDPNQTHKLPFYTSLQTTVDVPMMHRTGGSLYTETDTLQVLELPYSGGDIAMDILLPKAASSLEALEENATTAKLQAWFSELRPRTVDVVIPRFKLEKTVSLGKYLQNMGMINAFDEKLADFSAMSLTFLYITKVIHKAFIEVNEQGTEAAAATAVVMGTKAVVLDPVIFQANHPFIFIIRDVRSGSVLFMGRLVNPA